MKSLVALTALAAAAAIAAPAFAQTLPLVGPVTYNASLGYTGIDVGSLDFGTATLRAGADFAKYFGIEAEGSVGMVDQNPVVNGQTANAHVNDQYALYGVVRYPVTPTANLFVRGGYGHTDIKVTPLAQSSVTSGYDSWNYGAGGEYFLDGTNGLRLEYTRVDFQDRGLPDADTVSVSYVHKF